ncbi:hypothetical protein V8G54_014471 [Vigna mungo]|uniref:Uncharacterized protein n=1 Tax=Vigna mungo TaxID=3915 RepID=A0AAQ3NHK9_VIGMU
MRKRNTLFTIRPKMRAIERESSVVGPKQRKAALPSVTLERGLNDRSDELVLVDDEAKGPCTSQHVDADEEPLDVGVLVLLLLGQQHGAPKTRKKERKKESRGKRRNRSEKGI